MSYTLHSSMPYALPRKALATIAMITVAAGEVIGGAVFGFLGHLTTRSPSQPPPRTSDDPLFS